MAKVTAEEVTFISAINKENIEDLRDKIYSQARSLHEKRYPYNNFLY
jgi:GTP-binding protein HflX